jgi:hypothetical protein
MEAMQAWSRRDLEAWRYEGCGGMEVRSGDLEGVPARRHASREVWRVRSRRKR